MTIINELDSIGFSWSASNTALIAKSNFSVKISLLASSKVKIECSTLDGYKLLTGLLYFKPSLDQWAFSIKMSPYGQLPESASTCSIDNTAKLSKSITLCSALLWCNDALTVLSQDRVRMDAFKADTEGKISEYKKSGLADRVTKQEQKLDGLTRTHRLRTNRESKLTLSSMKGESLSSALSVYKSVTTLNGKVELCCKATVSNTVWYADGLRKGVENIISMLSDESYVPMPLAT